MRLAYIFLMFAINLHRAFSTVSLPRLRLVLVRHGESQNNVLNEISKETYIKGRHADPHLTDLGQTQAARTASYLSSDRCHPLLKKIEHVYVSPFTRTLQTAHPIVNTIKCSSTVWSDIYEVSGCYEGKVGLPGLKPGDIKSKYGYDTSLMKRNSNGEDVGWYELESKETYPQAIERIKRVEERIRNMASSCESDKTICLVVHGDFIDILLNHLLGMPANPSVARFRTYNTSISVVDVFKNGMVALAFSNFHEHLDGELCKREKLGVV
jgi:broad specificity phosphatase PhoE